MHSFVSNTLAPYFKSYVKRGAGGLANGNDQAPPNTNMSSNSSVLDTSTSANGSATSSSAGAGQSGSSSSAGAVVPISASGSGSGGNVSANAAAAAAGGDQFAALMEKRIADIELGFLHLQQNIEIPEITLPIHAEILRTIGVCVQKEQRRARVDDFAELIEKASFLNELQNGVNRWVREIKKVTKLDRDPSTGTALQEITFWMNLERALNGILERRESFEVMLTLDVLRAGKRFIATVSFDSDTGLREAIETAKDYNQLMKDFPLNDLISATELDKIAAAITAIFTHLKKMRNSKYPHSRALKLVEAISKDLTSQLLRVLSTQRVMIVPFDEFERTMRACGSVFAAWDDEYEKLQGMLRDLAKRKRDEFKITWRINPTHKRLQTRLQNMHK